MENITMVLTKHGKVISVYSKSEDAKAVADKFNADPFVEPGTPDPDAPYTIGTWRVKP